MKSLFTILCVSLVGFGCAHVRPPEEKPPATAPVNEAAELMLPTMTAPCPAIDGTYEAHDNGQVKKGRFVLSSEKLSFPGSENLIPDGQKHLIPGSKDYSYVAKCFDGFIDIKVSRVGKKPFRFVRYNFSENTIRDQTITFHDRFNQETEVEVEELEWRRVPGGK